ncbi:MAG: serine hydrolase domain-containing protein [Gammaproteobacteria bacterium]|nr:serine hydrolase domain-containing protein [Gammaproteobacteria bacterium]
MPASKWLTGAVFACLADRGELELNAPLASLVPDAPPGWDDLTLMQMLTHTAGAPADRLLSLPADPDLRSPGRALARTHLPEDAGEVFRYGDVSMQVAGWAAEAATGRSWRRLFVECLSWPLSLDSAAWGHPLSGPDLEAPALPGSGLHLSLDDYGAFLSMLQQRGRYEGVRNLSPGAIRLLETERIGDLPREDLPVGVDPDWGYALGVWCETRSRQGDACE